MTLEEMMNDLQLKFMDKRNRRNRRNRQWLIKQ
jgi:hypothetical protein